VSGGDASTSAQCDVAILVGGMGTRLKSRTGELPKPMAPIGDEPVLGHLLNLCRKNGLRKIALLAGYGHESIQAYFGAGDRYGVELTYCIETEARGTAGALSDALPHLAPRFMVMYGDTYASVDLRKMLDWHESKTADATLFVHPNDHPEDSDIVTVAAEGIVTGIRPYPRPDNGEYLRNRVNAALYIFEKDKVASALMAVGKADIAKHALPTLLDSGARVMAYISPEYIKDMGTPERLDKVAGDVIAGLPDQLSATRRRSAVFLDRDGTLNEPAGHISTLDDLRLLPGAGPAIRALNRSGLLAVLVTNQPVIARGEIDFAGLEIIHAKLETLLGRDGAYLDAIYFCPHHPDAGFAGERKELKISCGCRKPATGMLETAIWELGIDIATSWMVGDSTADICAGNKMGVSTILVATGMSGLDAKYEMKPDYRADNVTSAIDIILNRLSGTLEEDIL
jgi:histidinol-phosphate phosphatase family protein